MILNYASYQIEEILKEFSSSLEKGLLSKDVEILQKRFGLNTLKKIKFYALKIFFRQLKSPFILLLFATILISLLLKDIINSLIILVIILINVILSFFQEYRAQRILLLLKKHLDIRVKVLRDGKWQIIQSEALVPGDIIRLEPGDFIPADVRFLQSIDLGIDESILTGESSIIKKSFEQVNKEIKTVYQAINLGFMGTTVVSGSATAIVIATGQNTMFGTIVEESIETVQESNFEIQIRRLSKFILSVVIITLFLLFTLHFFLKDNVNVLQLLMFSLALALGLTPEALPTVITFALSSAAFLLSKKNVIIKRLSAIEDLGSLTILCTDKTGTLTENKLKIGQTYSLDPNLMLFALLTSSKNQVSQASFDKILWQNANSKEKNDEKFFEYLESIPFNPRRKRNTVFVKKNEKYFLIARGADDEILKLSNLNDISDSKLKDLNKFITNESSKGNRILGIAYKIFDFLPDDFEKEENNLNLAGFISFEDPIKPDVPKAVSSAKELGVDIKILTGDSKEVAIGVSKRIGFENINTLTGQDFDKLKREDKEKAVLQTQVFARVLPEQKYEIICILQELGKSVGFLGEGINDAPALKKAHVGIVVQNASDVAKDSADVILLNKDLMSIIDGIKYGRIVTQNIIKYLIITLSSNFGNFYSIAIISLFINFLPLLPVQILLLNIISDLPMISISTDNVDLEQLKKPSKYALNFIGFMSTFFGFISSIFDFVFFSLFFRFGEKILQTGWFIMSILTEIFVIFSLRTKKIFFKAVRPSFYLMTLSISAFIVTIFLPITQFGNKFFGLSYLNFNKILILFGISMIYFIINEVMKFTFLKWVNNNKH